LRDSFCEMGLAVVIPFHSPRNPGILSLDTFLSPQPFLESRKAPRTANRGAFLLGPKIKHMSTTDPQPFRAQIGFREPDDFASLYA
jgi:hypothetical protein